MPLINCEINLSLAWSGKFAIFEVVGAKTYAITDTKIYVAVVTY